MLNLFGSIEIAKLFTSSERLVDVNNTILTGILSASKKPIGLASG